MDLVSAGLIHLHWSLMGTSPGHGPECCQCWFSFKRNLPATEGLLIPNAISMSEVPQLLLFHVSKQGFSASDILREMSKKNKIKINSDLKKWKKVKFNFCKKKLNKQLKINFNQLQELQVYRCNGQGFTHLCSVKRQWLPSEWCRCLFAFRKQWFLQIYSSGYTIFMWVNSCVLFPPQSGWHLGGPLCVLRACAEHWLVIIHEDVPEELSFGCD